MLVLFKFCLFCFCLINRCQFEHDWVYKTGAYTGICLRGGGCTLFKEGGLNIPGDVKFSLLRGEKEGSQPLRRRPCLQVSKWFLAKLVQERYLTYLGQSFFYLSTYLSFLSSIYLSFLVFFYLFFYLSILVCIFLPFIYLSICLFFFQHLYIHLFIYLSIQLFLFYHLFFYSSFFDFIYLFFYPLSIYPSMYL